MTFQKIAIMSIGEMGFHWAKLLKSHGVEVMTFDRDRGEVSRKRAENAGVKSLASMAELVQQAELIVSIVVPFAAPKVAAKVAEAVAAVGRKDLLYLDANAISPMSAGEITDILKPAGVNFVDGCIIGGASKMGKGTTVYVSGPDAARLQALEAFSIPTKILGTGTTQASAYKIIYAGLTKGLQGLFCELLMGARQYGLLRELRAQWEESYPGLLDKVSGSIVGLRIHAGRRAEEMDELRRTFNAEGLNSYMAPGAQKVLEAIAALNAGKSSDSGGREGDLEEALELFYQRGLLRIATAGKKS